MIHVDICRDREDLAADVLYPKLLVQTSTDGAGWITQYVFYVDAVDALDDQDAAMRDQQNRAADCARIFVNACRYCGADVRATMFGYSL